MSYTIIQQQTPQVPELDWDNLIEIEIKYTDVPKNTSTSTNIDLGTMDFSGVVIASLSYGWASGTNGLVGVSRWVQTEGGGHTATTLAQMTKWGVVNAVVSKGDWIVCQFRRSDDSTSSTKIRIIPWKGQF